MQEREITINLNGHSISLRTDPSRPLVDILREDLDLTGTKRGCDYEGQCGACTVLVDGRAARSCITSLEEAAGKQIVTIEGLAGPEGLHPIQQSFLDNGAVQCGFCTPGMIMATTALLNRNPNPTVEDVKRGLAGNLCRCTGYVKIVGAVQNAAAILRGEAPSETTGQEAIAVSRWQDGANKVTGKTKFTDDLKEPGLLYAKVLRSPHPNASILSIDTRRALDLEGVKAVVTAADIPGKKAFSEKWLEREAFGAPDVSSCCGAEIPVLAIDRVRMIGDPVAIVVAVDEVTAEKALGYVQVGYKLMEPVYDFERDPTTTLLYAVGDQYESGEMLFGDWNAAKAQTEIEVETSIAVPSREHAALEPESIVAYMDSDGRVVATGTIHDPHMCQKLAAAMLDLPLEKVHIKAAPLGGSFGGRHNYSPILLGSLAAFILEKPVRLTYSRREVFEATNKDYPFKMNYRIGATREGKLTSLWGRSVGDAGPYGFGRGAAPFVTVGGVGPYMWMSIDQKARTVFTNGGNSGPLRGYALPHGVLGLETAMDELAIELGIDPWELRMRNAADGDSGAATCQKFDEPFGFRAVLEAIKPDWDAALARKRAFPSNGNERYGVGLAASWYQFGKGGRLQSHAEAELTRHGRIVIRFVAMNSGQGIEKVMSKFAAQELGIAPERLDLISNDSAETVNSNVMGAAKSVYWLGAAVIEAARVLKNSMLRVASSALDVPSNQLVLGDDGVCVSGDATVVIGYAELAKKAEQQGMALRHTGTRDLENRRAIMEGAPFMGHFVVGATVSEVVVSIVTGKVKVERLVVAQDVGKAINPIDVQGQLEGTAIMELGAALIEEYEPGKTLDFKSYPIPRMRDLPVIKTIIVEVEGEAGPRGAKGLGEASTGHPRSSIINAVSNAIGKRITRLPALPKQVLADIGR